MAKTTRYFVAPLRASLGSGGSATLTYQNSGNQVFHIEQIIQKSTGSFDITDFNTNQSFQYSNASPSNPLNGEIFPDMQTDTDSLEKLTIPIVLSGQAQIKFTVLDTSVASNVVDIVLVGYLEMED